MVSSLGGSAFQAFCPPAIANSFVGVTAFSAIMGGAGAYLGGARSPEEILMGIAAGAMTGALNAGIHRIQSQKIKNDKLKEAKPTVTTKTHVPIAIGIVDVEVYGTQTVEGSPNAEVVMNANTGKPEAEIKRYLLKLIKVTTSTNSISIGGDGISFGIGGDNKITVDASLFKWGNSGWGFKFSFDSRLLLIPVIIYNPQPVLQMVGR